MKNIKKTYFSIMIILVLSGILVTYTAFLKHYAVNAVASVFTPIKMLALQKDSDTGR